jgi:hypothetical protein
MPMLSESDRYSRIKTARAIPPSTSNQVVRIGDRDPQTGLHQTIDACGNEALNGDKIFSSQHSPGDVVRATRAGGSTLLQLDNINARSQVQERSILGDNCPGYFNGQIFNCEEEARKKESPLVQFAWIAEIKYEFSSTENRFIFVGVNDFRAENLRYTAFLAGESLPEAIEQTISNVQNKITIPTDINTFTEESFGIDPQEPFLVAVYVFYHRQKNDRGGVKIDSGFITWQNFQEINTVRYATSIIQITPYNVEPVIGPFPPFLRSVNAKYVRNIPNA